MSLDRVISTIKERIDIVEYVSRFVYLKRSGSSYRGLCPFHQEKTPSFYVNSKKALFHCFGCGEGGDLIRFNMLYRGNSFGEAVEELAEIAGIDLSGISLSARESQKERAHRDRLLSVNAKALEYYQRWLSSSDRAKRYARERGLDRAAIVGFKIGFAPETQRALVEVLEGGEESLVAAEELGLVAKRSGRYYDVFIDRLIFPIIDHRGLVLGFAGRSLGNREPKYLNSKDSLIFKKSRVLFGMNVALSDMRKERLAYITEGYMDCVALHRAGLKNAVAVCGTALTEGHAKLLSRFVDEAVLVFDGDDTGKKAVLPGIKALTKQGIYPRVVILPEGEDPDSLLKQMGRGLLKEYIEGNRQDGYEYLVETYVANKSLDTKYAVEGFKKIKEVVSAIGDEVLKEAIFTRLSRILGVSVETLRRDASKKGEERVNKINRFDKIHPAERFLLGILLYDESVLSGVSSSELLDLIDNRDIAEAINEVTKGMSYADLIDQSAERASLISGCLMMVDDYLGSSSGKDSDLLEKFRECVDILKRRRLERDLQEISRRMKSSDLDDEEKKRLLKKRWELKRMLELKK